MSVFPKKEREREWRDFLEAARSNEELIVLLVNKDREIHELQQVLLEDLK